MYHTINLHADSMRMSNIEEVFNEQQSKIAVFEYCKQSSIACRSNIAKNTYVCKVCIVSRPAVMEEKINDSNQILLKIVRQRNDE